MCVCIYMYLWDAEVFEAALRIPRSPSCPRPSAFSGMPSGHVIPENITNSGAGTVSGDVLSRGSFQKRAWLLSTLGVVTSVQMCPACTLLLPTCTDTLRDRAIGTIMLGSMTWMSIVYLSFGFNCREPRSEFEADSQQGRIQRCAALPT